MPIATHTLQGDFSGLVGEVTSIRATINTNSADGGWVNDVDNVIVLGGTVLAVGADGKFTVTLPTSTGTGLQYQVTAEFVDAERTRKTWESGWFSLTASGDLADLANDSTLRVNTTLGNQLAARIDGYQDHGNISGAVTFNGPTGSHWFDATAATTITLAGFAEGQVVSLLPFSGAANVTLADLPDVDLTDGIVTSAMLARGAWITGGGGSSAPTDTTPPSAPTGLTATGGAGELTFSFTPGTDADSAVTHRYEVYTGTSAGTSSLVTANPMTVTGLTAGTYTVRLFARSAGGNSTVVTTTATVTTPPGWNAVLADAFTATDGTLAGHVPNVTPNGAAWTTGTSPDYVAIVSNKITHNPTGYNPVAAIGIPAVATTGLSMLIDVDMNQQTDSGTPSLIMSMLSPSNNEDLRLTLTWVTGGTITVGAEAGNGGGTITLTGTTTGLPDTGRYGFRWTYSSRLIEVMHDGAVVATGTTAVPTYPRNFTQVRLSMGSCKSSTFDNFTVENLT